MASDTEDVIDNLFHTLLQRFQRAQETSNERVSKLIPDSVELLYYHFNKEWTLEELNHTHFLLIG